MSYAGRAGLGHACFRPVVYVAGALAWAMCWRALGGSPTRRAARVDRHPCTPDQGTSPLGTPK